MSAYRRVEIEFKDEAALVAALNDWCRANGAELESAQGSELELVGYAGKGRGLFAKYVIRHEDFNRASNDLGFAQREDGSFDVIISEYDSYGSGFGRTKGHDILEYAKQRYSYHRAVAHASAKGFMVQEQVLSDGTIKLELVRTY